MLVLRDVEEDGHLEALEEAAKTNMEALWRDVDKPSRPVFFFLDRHLSLASCGVEGWKCHNVVI